ncbi:MAG: hypothetical protein VB084_13560 [Syntrophomonadaceae bacterium]|nr:hypothetical protein [Syntrophomonadaceae bacterium]
MIHINAFKQSILNFQQNQDETIINKIFELSDINFLKLNGLQQYYDDFIDNQYFDDDEEEFYKKSDTHHTYPEPEYYIAIKIKVLREKITHESHFTRKSFTRERQIYNDALEYLKEIFGIEKYEDIFGDDMIEIMNYLPRIGISIKELTEIHKVLFSDKSRYLLDDEYIGKRELINQQLKESLKNALLKVEVKNRTDKEIVKFTNRVLSTTFIYLQIKETGSVRLQRNNKKDVYVVVPTWDKPLATALGFETKEEDLQMSLNRNQYNLLKRILSIINRDIEQGNINQYKYTDWGKTRINKRYIAKQLKMEETNFKQQLNRIKEKIKIKNIEKYCNVK